MNKYIKVKIKVSKCERYCSDICLLKNAVFCKAYRKRLGFSIAKGRFERCTQCLKQARGK